MRRLFGSPSLGKHRWRSFQKACHRRWRGHDVRIAGARMKEFLKSETSVAAGLNCLTRIDNACHPESTRVFA
jgi:hypothetical protein